MHQMAQWNTTVLKKGFTPLHYNWPSYHHHNVHRLLFRRCRSPSSLLSTHILSPLCSDCVLLSVFTWSNDFFSRCWSTPSRCLFWVVLDGAGCLVIQARSVGGVKHFIQYDASVASAVFHWWWMVAMVNCNVEGWNPFLTPSYFIVPSGACVGSVIWNFTGGNRWLFEGLQRSVIVASLRGYDELNLSPKNHEDFDLRIIRSVVHVHYR